MVADPSSRPAGEGMPFERAQDALIAARRHLSAAETVADYADISTKAIDILAGLLGAETEGPLGDLGTYPAGILPNAFCFDHYAHTRLDLFPPRGPLTGEPHRPGPLRSGLPWTGHRPHCPSRTARSWPAWPGRWRPSSPGRERGPSRSGRPETRLVRITSDAGAFLRWVTQRATPEEAGAEVSGDSGQLAIAQAPRLLTRNGSLSPGVPQK